MKEGIQSTAITLHNVKDVLISGRGKYKEEMFIYARLENGDYHQVMIRGVMDKELVIRMTDHDTISDSRRPQEYFKEMDEHGCIGDHSCTQRAEIPQQDD